MSPFRPIPPGMPLDAAANLMVRRGECANFFLARARLARKRRCYGRTVITPADQAAFKTVEAAKARLPYKDND